MKKNSIPDNGPGNLEAVEPNIEWDPNSERRKCRRLESMIVYKRKNWRKIPSSSSLQVLDTAHPSTSGTRKKRKTLATSTPTPTPVPTIKEKPNLHDAFKNRTSPNGLFNLVRGLSDAQKEAVKAIGFGSILSLSISKCPIELCRHLVTNFDPRRSAFILSTGELLPIDEEDVQCVLNIPRGDIEITESNGKTSDGPEYLEMLRAWRTRWIGKPNIGAPLVVKMPVKIKANTDADDDFKRDFVVYVVSSFLWTTQNSQCRFKILKSLKDVDKIKDLNWCKFTLDGLLDSVEKWQQNTASYFHGPLTFLLLCYMDRVAEYTVRRKYVRVFPILSCWDDKMVYERKDAEEKRGGFGRGRVVDRITLPVPLSANACVEQAVNANTVRAAELISSVVETSHPDPPILSVVAASLELSRAANQVRVAAQHLTALFAHYEAPNIIPLESCVESLVETIEMIKELHNRTRSTESPYEQAPSPSEQAPSPSEQAPSPSGQGAPSEHEEGVLRSKEQLPIYEDAIPEPVVPIDEEAIPRAAVPIHEEAIPKAVVIPKMKRNTRGRRTVFSNPHEVLGLVSLSEIVIEDIKEEERPPLAITMAETSKEQARTPLPTAMDEPSKKQEMSPRPKRTILKLPAALRSPYLTSIHKELTMLRPVDKAIADLVFADGLDLDQVLYLAGNIVLKRGTLQTMHEGECLNAGIIDAWAFEMNKISQDVGRKSKRRVFFSTMHCACIGLEAEMYNRLMLEETERFGISLQHLREADLIFLPIGWSEHFYLVVYNMWQGKFDVIDNRRLEKGVPFDAKYAVLEVVSKMFLGFMESLEKDMSFHLQTFKQRLVKLPWQDNDNFVDCGIYCMRHMEKYGGVVKNWDCGITLDNARQKLHFWRIQFLSRLLGSVNNNVRKEVKCLQSRLYGVNVV